MTAHIVTFWWLNLLNSNFLNFFPSVMIFIFPPCFPHPIFILSIFIEIIIIFLHIYLFPWYCAYWACFLVHFCFEVSSFCFLCTHHLFQILYQVHKHRTLLNFPLKACLFIHENILALYVCILADLLHYSTMTMTSRHCPQPITHFLQ